MDKSKPIIKWYVAGVEFDTAEEFVSIMKLNPKAKKWIRNKYLSEIESRNDPNLLSTEAFMKIWDIVKPITPDEITKRYSHNLEQLQAILKIKTAKSFEVI